MTTLFQAESKWHCVTKELCRSLESLAHEEKCLARCPSFYKRETVNGVSKCVPCNGTCTKGKSVDTSFRLYTRQATSLLQTTNKQLQSGVDLNRLSTKSITSTHQQS